MGHGKETPRQKMIGMMYLVLTALLALNVSKDVLDAFVIVDHGLHQTTENFASKNEGMYSRFSLAYDMNPEKAGVWKEKADKVQNMSNELYDFITECKVEILSVKETQAIIDGEPHLDEVKGKDNNNVPGEIMITKGKGKVLKEKIEEYKAAMINVIAEPEKYERLIESIEGNLDTHDHPAEKKGEPDIPWEVHNYEHLPLAAVITILSEQQAKVRNVESDVINYLLGQVGAKDFKVNKTEAIVLANSNVVFKGQEYTASVLLAGYDSTKVPEVILDNGTQLEVEGGRGIYKRTQTNEGIYKWGGILRLDNDGELIEHEFEATYRVEPTNAVISATKMNVFYRGVDNPVSVSASGVPESSIKPRITAGKILPTPDGNYIVQPGPREDESTIKVYADVEGTENFMGEMKFRVLNLPDPIAKVEGIEKGSGSMSLGQLTRLAKVYAEPDDFLFDVEFEITGFDVNVIGSGGINVIEHSDDGNFTAKQKTLFRGLRPGQRAFIEDIQAIGPDGQKRTLNTITIKIQ